MNCYAAPLAELPDPLPIEPLDHAFDVRIVPPGSKSITNRAYVLAGLAEGESCIKRPLRADDTDRLLTALQTLGVKTRIDGNDVFITGCGGRFPNGGEINLGDGGTPTRFMIACACLANEAVVIDGSERMRERPIAEGVNMLRELGAKIEYIESDGRLPVRVRQSDQFNGGRISVGATASSQFISALMLIAPHLKHGVELQFDAPPTSASYIHLTAEIMRQWGVEVDTTDPLFDPQSSATGMSIRPSSVESRTCTIEPDASSCAYWYAAAAMIPGARASTPLSVVDSCQPDRRVALALNTLGCDLEFNHNEERASTIIGPQTLHCDESIDASLFPDGAMAISVVAARAESPTTITGLHTLRVKETDRIAALTNELNKIGCSVDATDDSLTITPPTADTDPEPVVIETYNDHRMAMAFAVLGLVRPGISIRNPRCVDKSYPTFWRDFSRLFDRSYE